MDLAVSELPYTDASQDATPAFDEPDFCSDLTTDDCGMMSSNVAMKSPSIGDGDFYGAVSVDTTTGFYDDLPMRLDVKRDAPSTGNRDFCRVPLSNVGISADNSDDLAINPVLRERAVNSVNSSVLVDSAPKSSAGREVNNNEPIDTKDRVVFVKAAPTVKLVPVYNGQGELPSNVLTWNYKPSPSNKPLVYYVNKPIPTPSLPTQSGGATLVRESEDAVSVFRKSVRGSVIGQTENSAPISVESENILPDIEILNDVSTVVHESMSKDKSVNEESGRVEKTSGDDEDDLMTVDEWLEKSRPATSTSTSTSPRRQAVSTRVRSRCRPFILRKMKSRILKQPIRQSFTPKEMFQADMQSFIKKFVPKSVLDEMSLTTYKAWLRKKESTEPKSSNTTTNSETTASEKQVKCQKKGGIKKDQLDCRLTRRNAKKSKTVVKSVQSSDNNKKNLIYCTDCDQSWNLLDMNEMLKHKKICPLELVIDSTQTEFNCRLCSFSIDSVSELLRHYTDGHKIKKIKPVDTKVLREKIHAEEKRVLSMLNK